MPGRVFKRIIIVWAFLILVTALIGRVGVAASNAGNTAADFLQIGVGANAAAMAGAYSSAAAGASAAFWNPARLGAAGRSEITFSHFLWYQGINLDHGAASIMLSPRWAIGASVTFLNYGTIEGYDVNGNGTGSVSSYDIQGGLSVSYGLSDKFTVGFTGKYVGEKLAEIHASTFAGDVGLSYQENRWSASVVAANFGPDMKFLSTPEHLPSSVRLAVSATPIWTNVLASMEIEKRVYGDVVVHNGVEFSFNQQYYLRGGISYFPQNDVRSFGTGFSLGAGVRLGKTELDYAFTPKDSYTSESLHRFTFVIGLGR